jgi:uncharacterized protein YcbX
VTVWPKSPKGLAVFPSPALFLNPPLPEYFDAFPIHILTTTSLASLAALRPATSFDVRRFRPNFVIQTQGAEGFPELDWGGKLRIGGATLNLGWRTGRCVMTTLPQGELPADAEVLKTIVQASKNKLGVYATVAAPGPVAVGDRVALS